MDMTHLATVKLPDGNIYDITTRLEEIHMIRQWINELVGYDETKFEMRYMSSGDCIKIWFDDEKHAMLCTLRWG
jgi:hypothetical protein